LFIKNKTVFSEETKGARTKLFDNFVKPSFVAGSSVSTGSTIGLGEITGEVV